MPGGQVTVSAGFMTPHPRPVPLAGRRRRLRCHRHRTLPFLPSMTATVFDLQHVTEFAAAKIAAAGLSDRIIIITPAAGDLFAPASYPTGHDIALLSLILHSFTPGQDRQIVAKTFGCLPSGGLVISETADQRRQDQPRVWRCCARVSSLYTASGTLKPGLSLTLHAAATTSASSQVLTGLATLDAAEAHAMIGDRRSSEQALGTADAHFSQIQPDDPAIDLSPTQPGPPGRRSSGRQPRYAG